MSNDVIERAEAIVKAENARLRKERVLNHYAHAETPWINCRCTVEFLDNTASVVIEAPMIHVVDRNGVVEW